MGWYHKSLLRFTALVLILGSGGSTSAEEPWRYIPDFAAIEAKERAGDVYRVAIIIFSPINFPYTLADRTTHEGLLYNLVTPEKVRVDRESEEGARVPLRIDVTAEHLFSQDYSRNRPMIAVTPVTPLSDRAMRNPLIVRSASILKMIQDGEDTKHFPMGDPFGFVLHRSEKLADYLDHDYQRVIYLPPGVDREMFGATMREYTEAIDAYCEEKGYGAGRIALTEEVLADAEYVRGSREVVLDLSELIDTTSPQEYEFDLSLIYYETRGIIFRDSFERGEPAREPDPPLLKTHVADTARIKVVVE